MSKKTETALPHCARCGKQIPLHNLTAKRVACVELFYHTKPCSIVGERCVLTGVALPIEQEQTLTDDERRKRNAALRQANSPRRWLVHARAVAIGAEA